MKLISTAIPLAALFSAASAVNVRYGKLYTHWYESPSEVDCFRRIGSPLHGLTYFHDVKTWPFIGGSDTVNLIGVGCGSCWQISYEGKTVNITAVDSTKDGFKISGKAMDALTNDKKAILDATATKIDKSYCGL